MLTKQPPPGCSFNDEPSDDWRNVASESETKLQVTLVLCSLTEGNDVAQNYQIERQDTATADSFDGTTDEHADYTV